MGRRSSLLARYAVDATRRPVATRHLTEEEARAKGQRRDHFGDSGGDTTQRVYHIQPHRDPWLWPWFGVRPGRFRCPCYSAALGIALRPRRSTVCESRRRCVTPRCAPPVALHAPGCGGLVGTDLWPFAWAALLILSQSASKLEFCRQNHDDVVWTAPRCSASLPTAPHEGSRSLS